MSLELLGTVLVIACAPVVLIMLAVGVAWTMRRGTDVAASPADQAHDQGTGRAPAGAGAAAATVHRLPARRDDGDALAARAPRSRVAGRADDDRELWPLAHLVPVVQASLQPVGRWNARRPQDERAARRDHPSGAGTPALVRAIGSWGFAGVVVGGRPMGRAAALRAAIEAETEAF